MRNINQDLTLGLTLVVVVVAAAVLLPPKRGEGMGDVVLVEV